MAEYCLCPCQDSCHQIELSDRGKASGSGPGWTDKEYQQLAVLGGVGVNLLKLPSCSSLTQVEQTAVFSLSSVL